MLKGSLYRQADHSIDELFLDRWSPRAMSGQSIAQEDLFVLFEAARWAPSSYNNQPWRMIYAMRETQHWITFLELLDPFNRDWAKNAAALVLFVSKTTFDHNGKPCITFAFDAGAAWQNFSLQGSLKGYVVHGMQGFDYDKAASVLKVPGDYKVQAMAAVGLPAPKETLPPALQERELPSDRRKLTQTVVEGVFAF
jgi:nitroreductase